MLYDLITIIGAPARFAARVLLFLSYLLNGYATLSRWSNNRYARTRFGPHYMYRPWLLFDIAELKQIERLVNDGSDDDLLKLRDSQLGVSQLVAIVGTLLAQAGVSALSLPLLEQTNYFARGLFTLSLVISLLAVFFTCVQQRSLRFIRQASEFRMWLTNGVRYKNENDTSVWQSSFVAHSLLNLPYELVAISIALFIAGLGVYLGSAWVRELGISLLDGVSVGNSGVAVAFIVGTTCACLLFGLLVGHKDVESQLSESTFNNRGSQGSLEESRTVG